MVRPGVNVWQNQTMTESFLRARARTPGTMRNTAPLHFPSIRPFLMLGKPWPCLRQSPLQAPAIGPSPMPVASSRSLRLPTKPQSTCGHLALEQRLRLSVLVAHVPAQNPGLISPLQGRPWSPEHHSEQATCVPIIDRLFRIINFWLLLFLVVKC